MMKKLLRTIMKKETIILSFGLTLLCTIGFGQNVGINKDGSTPDASAILDVKSTDKGFLTPRMTSAQRTALAGPAKGLLVFDNTTSTFWFF